MGKHVALVKSKGEKPAKVLSIEKTHRFNSNLPPVQNVKRLCPGARQAERGSVVPPDDGWRSLARGGCAQRGGGKTGSGDFYVFIQSCLVLCPCFH